ncbi:MAG: glycosyltransferase [Betaproteobacteria bacterium]|nr:glycosyltransferase [Betaproteobacteria bacterium]
MIHATAREQPRLLVMASTYPRWAGDPEPNFVHALCRRLIPAFEVHVVCPHAPGALPEEMLDGVQVHRFRYAPGRLESLVQDGGILNNLKHYRWKWLLVPLFFAGLGWKTWHLSRRLRPACLHAHWIVPQGLVAAGLGLVLRRPAPFLLTSHGGDLFGLRGRLFEWLKRAVIRRAAAITVVSRAMVDEAIRLGATPERVHVMPMGVDFDGLFAADPVEDRRPGEILFVGRLVEKKGLRYLIEAMPAIVERIPAACLKIVGHGPEEARLRTLAAQLDMTGHIEFIGSLPQTEIPPLYRRASVFVAPFVEAAGGDREGLGLVTVEAIACGCPVIVGDMPMQDSIFEPSEADLRVDPRQVDQLARRIVETLLNSEAAYARTLNMRDRLNSIMGWATVAEAYHRLLSSIIQHGGSGRHGIGD